VKSDILVLEIQQLLPSIQPIFSREFAFYALLDKPKEYGWWILYVFEKII
jgi:hypothetical protein